MNNIVEPVEHIIFNPIIYGFLRVYANDSDNDPNIINKTVFETDVEIKNNLTLNVDSKIILNENMTLFNDDLTNILKINTIESNLSDLSNNYNQHKIDTNTTLTNLSNNLDKYKKDTNLSLTNLSNNFEQYKALTDTNFNTLKNENLKIIKIGANIELTEIAYDIYIIENKIDITLPVITEELIGKKIMIINKINKSIKINTMNKNKINYISKTDANEYLLRNYNSISIICIDINTWIIY